MNNFISNKISIIVPVYNVEEYIFDCLDSISNQTYTDFEVLLINDGSKDNSKSICLDFIAKDSRFIYYEQENKGVSEARNFGIEKAKGEWICFVDPDDSLEENYLSHFSQSIENKSVLVITDINRISKNESLRNFFKFENSKINLDQDFIEIYNNKDKILGYPFNKIYNSSIIKKNKLYFQINQTIREDVMFNYDYIKLIKTLKIVSYSSYNYIYRENSAVTKNHDYMNYLRLCHAENELVQHYGIKYTDINKSSYLYFFLKFLKALFNSGSDKFFIYCMLNEFRNVINPNLIKTDSKRYNLYLFFFKYRLYRLFYFFYKKLS